MPLLLQDSGKARKEEKDTQGMSSLLSSVVDWHWFLLVEAEFPNQLSLMASSVEC